MEEVLVSGRDAGVGTDSWIGVDSWGGEMSWSGAEHPSWAKTPQLGGTAAMGGKARTGGNRHLGVKPRVGKKDWEQPKQPNQRRWASVARPGSSVAGTRRTAEANLNTRSVVTSPRRSR